MTGKAAMAEPAHHIPAQTPARHTDGQCGFGAAGASPTLARGVWTAHQAVDHLRRPLQRPEMMIAVVAHVHIMSADRARAVLDVQINPFSGRPNRPTIRHGRSILVLQSMSMCRCVIPTAHHSIITPFGGKTILAFGRIVLKKPVSPEYPISCP